MTTRASYLLDRSLGNLYTNPTGKASGTDTRHDTGRGPPAERTRVHEQPEGEGELHLTTRLAPRLATRPYDQGSANGGNGAPTGGDLVLP